MNTTSFYKKAVEKSFYIIDKEMQAIPFKLNPPQDRILKELSGMDIVLKARQEGVSSLILALFAIDFITIENIRCVVISHEDKATQRLFDRVKYFLESMKRTFPGDLPYQLDIKSRHELFNKTKNSYFYIGTAGARAFGHGDTINNLHISELSRWPEQERMMIGLLQAVPKDGRIIIETTANGFGDYFYKLWNQNKERQNPFRTHFIPWFELPEYVYPTGTVKLQYTDYEKELVNAYHLKPEQVSWRRWKINQMGGDWNDSKSWDSFNEQFPSTAEEAFVVSGNPVWSPTLLKYYITHCIKPPFIGELRGYTPITTEPNDKGHLKIWKEPKEFHTYAIGVDVSEGKIISQSEESKERDASCAQVLDKNTYEQVAVWHGRIDPDKLGIQLDMLGRYYNNALVAVERNAVGLTPLIKLRDLSYPNIYYKERVGEVAEKVTAELGWVTDRRTKEILISEATEVLRDKRLTIFDDLTIGEMMAFVRDAEGHAAAAKSAHDDRVMALLIAIRMLSRAKYLGSGNEIERSDSDIMDEKGFFMGGVAFNSKGWPVDPNSPEDDGGDII